MHHSAPYRAIPYLLTFVARAVAAQATRELSEALSACFELVQHPAGYTLYGVSDRPDCAYLIISGEITLLGPPPPPRKRSADEWVAPAPDDAPSPVVVATRNKSSEVPWAGESPTRAHPLATKRRAPSCNPTAVHLLQPVIRPSLATRPPPSSN